MNEPVLHARPDSFAEEEEEVKEPLMPDSTTSGILMRSPSSFLMRSMVSITVLAPSATTSFLMVSVLWRS